MEPKRKGIFSRIDYSKIRNYVGRKWLPHATLFIALLTLIAVAVGAYAAYRQVKIQATEFERINAKPVLYDYVIYDAVQDQSLEPLKRQMFYEMYERLNSHESGKNIDELLDEVLPIDRVIPPVSIRVEAQLGNYGEVALHDLYVRISWDGRIMKVDTQTLSTASIVSGGIDSSFVVVAIDRIVPKERVIIVTEYVSDRIVPDTLRLVSAFRAKATSAPMQYVVIQGESNLEFRNIKVTVASNETPLHSTTAWPRNVRVEDCCAPRDPGPLPLPPVDYFER